MAKPKKIEVDVILSEYQKQIDNFKKLDGNFEQISTLLLTHLYVEYFINLLIKNYFKLRKKILDDHNRYTFSNNSAWIFFLISREFVLWRSNMILVDKLPTMGF